MYLVENINTHPEIKVTIILNLSLTLSKIKVKVKGTVETDRNSISNTIILFIDNIHI